MGLSRSTSKSIVWTAKEEGSKLKGDEGGRDLKVACRSRNEQWWGSPQLAEIDPSSDIMSSTSPRHLHIDLHIHLRHVQNKEHKAGAQARVCRGIDFLFLDKPCSWIPSSAMIMLPPFLSTCWSYSSSYTPRIFAHAYGTIAFPSSQCITVSNAIARQSLCTRKYATSVARSWQQLSSWATAWYLISPQL